MIRLVAIGRLMKPAEMWAINYINSSHYVFVVKLV